MKIIIASQNKDKIQEFREILQDQRIEFISSAELGFHDKITEDGSSYRENARIKAKTVHDQFGGHVIADDSGLSVDKLDGYPGIYSARFAGEHTSYTDKIQRLHALLSSWPKEEWTAAFHCAICHIDPEGKEFYYEKVVCGLIIDHEVGENGFGYDPVFYLPELKQTNAQLPPEEKHKRSHRGLALRAWYNDFSEKYLKDEQ